MRWLGRKLKGGLGAVTQLSANPADWFLVAVVMVFVVLMLVYVMGVFNPDFAWWK